MPMEVRIVLTIIVLIVMAVILFRFRAGKGNSARRDSLEIMKERMEKGEISKEDYEEMKRKRGK